MQKPNLVLVPGLICTRDLYGPQIDALRDHAEIMVADHTRHESMAEIAASILAAAPERFALAGLSMGGYIAFEIMRQAPERVTRLALLDTSARPDTDDNRDRRAKLIALADKGKFKGVSKQLLPLFIHPDRLADEELTATIFKMAADTGKDAFKRQQTAILNRVDSGPNLQTIACQTCMIVGRQDALTPVEVAQEIAAGIPGAELNIIEDCGHLPTLETPDQVNDILKSWLLSR